MLGSPPFIYMDIKLAQVTSEGILKSLIQVSFSTSVKWEEYEPVFDLVAERNNWAYMKQHGIYLIGRTLLGTEMTGCL